MVWPNDTIIAEATSTTHLNLSFHSTFPPNSRSEVQTFPTIPAWSASSGALKVQVPCLREAVMHEGGAFHFSAQMYPDVSADTAADANISEQWRQLSSIKCPINSTG